MPSFPLNHADLGFPDSLPFGPFFFQFAFPPLPLCLLGPLNRGPPSHEDPWLSPVRFRFFSPTKQQYISRMGKGRPKKRREKSAQNIFSRACFHPLFSPFVFFPSPLRPLKVIVIASSLAPSFPLPYTPPYLRVLAWRGRWREGLPEAKEGDGGDFLLPHFRTRKNPHHNGATFPRRKLKLVIIFHCGKIPEKVSPPPPLRRGRASLQRLLLTAASVGKQKRGPTAALPPVPQPASAEGRGGRGDNASHSH